MNKTDIMRKIGKILERKYPELESCHYQIYLETVALMVNI